MRLPVVMRGYGVGFPPQRTDNW